MEGLDGQVAPAADAIHVAADPSSGAAEGRTTAAKKQSPKRFECTHPGCSKRFTRLEHMQRHALNHSGAGDFTCSRCSAHFRRPDLLGEPLKNPPGNYLAPSPFPLLTMAQKDT